LSAFLYFNEQSKIASKHESSSLKKPDRQTVVSDQLQKISRPAVVDFFEKL